MKKTQAAGRMPAPVQAPLAVGSTNSESSKIPAAGWDPYEVWRTRVLLPPVPEPIAKARAVDAELKPLLLQSA
jgi:hypothetical protein